MLNIVFLEGYPRGLIRQKLHLSHVPIVVIAANILHYKNMMATVLLLLVLFFVLLFIS